MMSTWFKFFILFFSNLIFWIFFFLKEASVTDIKHKSIASNRVIISLQLGES